MNNTRFATAIHILTLLAVNTEQWLSSEFIASSIQVNPAIVRKELMSLQKSGLVLGKKGKAGGSLLSRSAHTISMADVYNSIRGAHVLGRVHQEPSSKCPIGKDINDRLTALYDDAERALVGQLSEVSLADFAKRFD